MPDQPFSLEEYIASNNGDGKVDFERDLRHAELHFSILDQQQKANMNAIQALAAQ